MKHWFLNICNYHINDPRVHMTSDEIMAAVNSNTKLPSHVVIHDGNNYRTELSNINAPDVSFENRAAHLECKNIIAKDFFIPKSKSNYKSSFAHEFSDSTIQEIHSADPDMSLEISNVQGLTTVHYEGKGSLSIKNTPDLENLFVDNIKDLTSFNIGNTPKLLEGENFTITPIEYEPAYIAHDWPMEWTKSDNYRRSSNIIITKDDDCCFFEYFKGTKQGLADYFKIETTMASKRQQSVRQIENDYQEAIKRATELHDDDLATRTYMTKKTRKNLALITQALNLE